MKRLDKYVLAYANEASESSDLDAGCDAMMLQSRHALAQQFEASAPTAKPDATYDFEDKAPGEDQEKPEGSLVAALVSANVR